MMGQSQMNFGTAADFGRKVYALPLHCDCSVSDLD